MKVYFVGAGAGALDLLTVRAQRLLQTAACCIYAGSLVNPELLGLLPPEAERHDSAGLDLDQIVALFQEALRRGVDVVRLHTGEPCLYGAIAEQMDALDRLGISYEVVPGISAFQAAAAALRVELTAPEVAQTVILTRAPGRTPMPSSESLDHLAAARATLCIFLSADKIAETAPLLIEHYGADCPAALVYHASWPDQRIVRAALGEIAGRIEESGITRTAIFLVGRALERPLVAVSKLYDKTFGHGYRQPSGWHALRDEGRDRGPDHALRASGTCHPPKAGQIAIITLSAQGADIALKLSGHWPGSEVFVHEGVKPTGCVPWVPGPEIHRFAHITDLTRELFASYQSLVYVAPAGAVVRAVAPCLVHKTTDPAVVVIDVGGRWAVSLVGGHEAGANDLAIQAANVLGAEPVISTTSEAAKDLIVGVGCRRGATAQAIVAAVGEALAAAGCDLARVRLLASADIKAGEPGLAEAAAQLGMPLRLIAADEIRESLRPFTRSAFVEEKVDLPAVAEPAALLSGRRTRLLLPKQVFHGVTVAIARENCTPSA